MIVPVQVTWTTGQIVTAAQLNANIRDAVNFLLSPPFGVFRHVAVQSVANATWFPVGFDATDLDRDGGHSNTVSNSRYTCKTPGWYQINCTAAFAANATGIRIGAVYLNGSAKFGRQTWLATNGGTFPTEFPASGPVYLNVNDYIEWYVHQTSGGALNTDQGMAMSLRWVST